MNIVINSIGQALSKVSTEALWALLGVIVGVLLTEFIKARQEGKEHERVLAACKDELEANKFIINQKLDTLDQMNAALTKGYVLSGDGVPAVSTIFDNHDALLSQLLTPIQRDNLHVVYGRLKHHDRFMCEYEENVRLDFTDGVVKDPIGANLSKLSDVVASYLRVRNLIDLYLKGEPEDVLNRHAKQ